MTTPASLLARIGLRYPLIQAPMAGVSTPALAAAVSEAGGLGSLGLGASTVEDARRAIEQTRALTDRPFNVNLFCHAPAQRDADVEAAWLAYLAPLYAEVGAELPTALAEIYPSFLTHDAMLAMVLAERPAVVSFHFGLPAPESLAALKAAGIVTLATATSVAEAHRIEQAGIDGIVAQGIEAGGHRGTFECGETDEALSTAALLQHLVAQVRLPVVAAGGLMTGQDVRRVLEGGAVAAQLGTAFLLCPEAATNAGYRASLTGPDSGVTRLTATLSGRPARGIVNRFIRHAEAPDAPPVPAYPVAYDAAKRLNAAASARDDHRFAAHWAGTGAPQLRAMPAAELVATLINELGINEEKACLEQIVDINVFG